MMEDFFLNKHLIDSDEKPKKQNNEENLKTFNPLFEN